MFFFFFSPPVIFFSLFFGHYIGSLKDVQTSKLDSQTAANQLPPVSPVSRRVSDDPPSSGHSDWLVESRQGRGRGCGDSASLMMSSLSSRTTGSVTSRLAKMLNLKNKQKQNVDMRRETWSHLWDPFTSNLKKKKHFGADGDFKHSTSKQQHCRSFSTLSMASPDDLFIPAVWPNTLNSRSSLLTLSALSPALKLGRRCCC